MKWCSSRSIFTAATALSGCFFSSGIIQSFDYTMKLLLEVARILREEHDFRGYIHLKTIPDASPDLMARAGRHADRLSINVELPTVQSLQALAPEKDSAILQASANFYSAYQLRRVYYSAFSPIPDASASLPPRQPPLIREHRPYQADWLTRFYGFAHDEIVPGGSGMLTALKMQFTENGFQRSAQVVAGFKSEHMGGEIAVNRIHGRFPARR